LGTVSLHFVLRSPTLHVSWERYEHLKSDENPRGDIVSYSLSGTPVPDGGPLTLGFISEDGITERFEGPLHLSIGGHKERAMMWFWPPSDREGRYAIGENTLYFSINVGDEWMNWLWQEAQRPGARVHVSFQAELYQMGIEAAFSEPGDRQHIFMPKDDGDRRLTFELNDLKFRVVSGPEEPRDENEVDYDPMFPPTRKNVPERVESDFAKADWSQRTIILLLVLLILVTMFK
jgi:hypothetical protein